MGAEIAEQRQRNAALKANRKEMQRLLEEQRNSIHSRRVIMIAELRADPDPSPSDEELLSEYE